MMKITQNSGKRIGVVVLLGVMLMTLFLLQQPSYAYTLSREDGMPLLKNFGDATYWTKMAQPSLFNKFTVTYYPNGGDGQINEIAVNANADYTIESQGYTRRFYGFICWNTQPNGLGINYRNDDVIVVTDNIKLYAKWSART